MDQEVDDQCELGNAEYLTDRIDKGIGEEPAAREQHESRGHVLGCGHIDIETNMDPYRHVHIYAHRHRGLLVSASARLKFIF